MSTLNTVKFTIIYSTNGNVTLTKTVINAIAAIGTLRGSFSVEDITYAINAKLYSDEQITIKQVTAVVNAIAKCCKRGERYYGLKNVVAVRHGFYDYR